MAWKNGNKAICELRDIFLIWPMLKGTYRGKKGDRYVFGPCRHMSMQDGQSICMIHDIKPRLCSGYPYYISVREITMGETDPNENPGYIRGCGYNNDPEHGHTVEEIDAETIDQD